MANQAAIGAFEDVQGYVDNAKARETIFDSRGDQCSFAAIASAVASSWLQAAKVVAMLTLLLVCAPVEHHRLATLAAFLFCSGSCFACQVVPAFFGQALCERHNVAFALCCDHCSDCMGILNVGLH